MTAQFNVDALTAVVAANPADATATLILADAIQENGDEVAAIAMRNEVAALALRAEILKAKIWLREDQVFTLGTAKVTKGYGARQAEGVLTAKPEILVMIYADTAITKTGLKKVGNGPILYHRKSSGGKWGRSVQTFRVSL